MYPYHVGDASNLLEKKSQTENQNQILGYNTSKFRFDFKVITLEFI